MSAAVSSAPRPAAPTPTKCCGQRLSAEDACMGGGTATTCFSTVYLLCTQSYWLGGLGAAITCCMGFGWMRAREWRAFADVKAEEAKVGADVQRVEHTTQELTALTGQGSAEIQQLRALLEQQEGLLKERSGEISQQQTTIEQLRRTEVDLQGRLHDLDQAHQQLIHDLQAFQEDNVRLQTEQSGLAGDVKDLAAERAKLLSSSHDVENQLQTTIGDVQRHLQLARSSAQGVIQMLAERNKTLEAQLKGLSDTGRGLQATETSFETLQQKIDASTARLAAIEAQYSQVAAALENKRAELEAQETQQLSAAADRVTAAIQRATAALQDRDPV